MELGYNIRITTFCLFLLLKDGTSLNANIYIVNLALDCKKYSLHERF